MPYITLQPSCTVFPLPLHGLLNQIRRTCQLEHTLLLLSHFSCKTTGNPTPAKQHSVSAEFDDADVHDKRKNDIEYEIVENPSDRLAPCWSLAD